VVAGSCDAGYPTPSRPVRTISRMATPPAPPPSSPMAQALAWLRRYNVPHAQKTPHQIKIPPDVSYYPSTGTIYLDGDRHAVPAKGLTALTTVLGMRGYHV
jgi:hypothetical protein